MFEGRAPDLGYDIQGNSTTISDVSMEEDEDNTQMVTPTTSFKFFRSKTEKWGRMLLVSGYLILFFNLFAFVMTLANMLGFFQNADDPRFKDYDANASRFREQEYIATVENRTDLTDDQKFMLEAQESMEEQ